MPRTLRDTELLRISSPRPAGAGRAVAGRPVGVDRDRNMLLGYVVAQLGRFKSEGRGEFDIQSLETIVELGNKSKQGLKSHFQHESASSDSLGKYLGRAKDFLMSEAVNAEGKVVAAVRADLHFDRTALEESPNGGGKPLAEYVMDLAESDSDAISSSLVLRVKKEFRRNEDGTLMKDENGEELPPLWRPLKLWGSDIVDTGDAVDGLLGIDELPNSILWKATEFLNTKFEGLSREELKERVSAWFDKYLDGRYGPEPEEIALPPREPEAVASVQPAVDALAAELELRRRRNRLKARA